MEASVVGIIVKFRNPVAQKEYFFRQIFPDGRFYGEIMVVQADGPFQRNISGNLSPDDYETLIAVVDSLKQTSLAEEEQDGWGMLLAEGPVAHPVWIRHLKADSKTGSVFSKVMSILSKYG